MFATEALVFIVTLLVTAYYLSVRRPKNFPPGPRPWPILGNMFHIRPPQHKTFTEWGQKYGDIIGFYLGPRPVVVLNNYKHIKEALAENVFSGRVISNPIKDRNLGGDGNRGVLLSEGKVWSENRRFTLKVLRDFGFGKKSMESMVMEEVNELITAFRKQAGQPITTQNRFNIAVLNALWSIITGQRFSHDDARLKKLISLLTTIVVKRPLSSVLSELFPAFYHLRKTFPKLFASAGKNFQESTMSFITEVVEQHKETLQEDSPRDFIDVYLTEVKRTTDPNSPFYGENAELGLKVLMLDLFVAGAETTSTTLVWAFLILALNPDTQEKIINEIRNVVGSSRHVSLADRPQMPYLEATIMEILRYSAIISTGVPHKNLEDVQFHGYTIPKGTMIMYNIRSASRDPRAWGDADTFRPERFLSADQKSLIRHDAFIPFSTGRRVCLGETLARDELFLFLGNLIHQFKVSTVPDGVAPDLEKYSSSLILVPDPMEVVLTEREAA